jgi:hypothetical protein
MSRQRSAFTLLAALLGGLFTHSAARAYEEQVSVDLALGYAGVVDPEPIPSQLVSVDLSAAVGVADWLVVRSALGYGLLFGGDDELAQAGRLRLEGAYLLDVLQWVPFFGVGGGLWLLEERTGLAVRPAGHLLVGVDYLATRRWTFGCDVRIGLLWMKGESVSFTEGQLRISRMFDVFH